MSTYNTKHLTALLRPCVQLTALKPPLTCTTVKELPNVPPNQINSSIKVKISKVRWAKENKRTVCRPLSSQSVHMEWFQ